MNNCYSHRLIFKLCSIYFKYVLSGCNNFVRIPHLHPKHHVAAVRFIACSCLVARFGGELPTFLPPTTAFVLQLLNWVMLDRSLRYLFPFDHHFQLLLNIPFDKKRNFLMVDQNLHSLYATN